MTRLLVGGQAAVLVSGAVPRQAMLGLAAVAGHERDPPPVVLLDQVSGERADAAGIVDRDARHARLGRADHAHRQRAQPIQHGAHPRVAVAGAHRPRHEDAGVEVTGAGQGVDEVARIGGRDVAARQSSRGPRRARCIPGGPRRRSRPGRRSSRHAGTGRREASACSCHAANLRHGVPPAGSVATAFTQMKSSDSSSCTLMSASTKMRARPRPEPSSRVAARNR